MPGSPDTARGCGHGEQWESSPIDRPSRLPVARQVKLTSSRHKASRAHRPITAKAATLPLGLCFHTQLVDSVMDGCEWQLCCAHSAAASGADKNRSGLPVLPTVCDSCAPVARQSRLVVGSHGGVHLQGEARQQADALVMGVGHHERHGQDDQ